MGNCSCLDPTDRGGRVRVPLPETGTSCPGGCPLLTVCNFLGSDWTPVLAEGKIERLDDANIFPRFRMGRSNSFAIDLPATIEPQQARLGRWLEPIHTDLVDLAIRELGLGWRASRSCQQPLFPGHCAR